MKKVGPPKRVCDFSVQPPVRLRNGHYLVELSFSQPFSKPSANRAKKALYAQCESNGKVVNTDPRLDQLSFPGQCSATWKQVFDDIANFIISQTLFSESEDTVLIAESDSEAATVISVVQSPTGVWKGEMVEGHRPKNTDVTYALDIELEERTAHLENLFPQLKDWLPAISSCAGFGQGYRTLTIKVPPSELWFLRFPINQFCKLKYFGFGSYSDVEWIVTNRSYIENSRIRRELRSELVDLSRLITHSVVIINTYEVDEENEKYREGNRLIKDVLDCFENVDLNDRKVSLRWRFNPSADEIANLLLDRLTLYFFADFEARTGEWELGQHQSTIPQNGKRSPQFFVVKNRHLDLSHIHLMRVFHCNSVFNPSTASGRKREPADNHSIVRHLLEAGAQRVEGGVTEESYFDYLCSLFQLFCNPAHFGFVLRLKCLELGNDYCDLMEQVNSFVTAFGWPPIIDIHARTGGIGE